MLDYKEQNYGFDTLMIHAGTQADPVTHAVNLTVRNMPKIYLN